VKLAPCLGCGGLFEEIDGPTHRYMESSPGCWAAYGEVLAREYANADYFEVHRLTVDAYAVQHPGRPSRQSIQSIALHLMRLYLLLERSLEPASANHAMRAAAKLKRAFVWLEPPETMGSFTVANVRGATGIEAHKRTVRAWAVSAWDAWSKHHDTVRTWAQEHAPRPQSMQP
jgi:hypothetical protein